MKKRSKTQLLVGICALILVIAVQTVAGQFIQRSPHIANLSADRGLGVGVALGRPSEVFLSYSLLDRLDLGAGLAIFAGDIYFGGALGLRLLDMRAFDLLLHLGMSNFYAAETMMGFGGMIAAVGMGIEYSITKHLALSALLSAGVHMSPTTGMRPFLGSGLGVTYYL